MRLQSVIAPVLLATAALAAPVNIVDNEADLASTSIDAQLDANITTTALNITDGAQAEMTPDGFPPFKCQKNFIAGHPLTKLERILMKVCFNTLLGGKWNIINCWRTDRVWQTWGSQWSNTDDCLDACRECVLEAIEEFSPNVQCIAKAAPLAECSVQYM